MNDLLKTISTNAAEDLKALIAEGAEDILKAIHKTEEEAQANDSKPKFSLGFKITVDFDAASYNCDLSWTLKQTLGTTHTIDDPNQPGLPMEVKAGLRAVQIHTKDGTKIFDSSKSAAEFITTDAKKKLSGK